MIYEKFVNLLARGKVKPDTDAMKAYLVKGYDPDPKHSLTMVETASVGYPVDVGSKSWEDATLHVSGINFAGQDIETKDADGVVFVVAGVPACHCEFQAVEEQEDAKYFIRELSFPTGILEVTR